MLEIIISEPHSGFHILQSFWYSKMLSVWDSGLINDHQLLLGPSSPQVVPRADSLHLRSLCHFYNAYLSKLSRYLSDLIVWKYSSLQAYGCDPIS